MHVRRRRVPAVTLAAALVAASVGGCPPAAAPTGPGPSAGAAQGTGAAAVPPPAPKPIDEEEAKRRILAEDATMNAAAHRMVEEMSSRVYELRRDAGLLTAVVTIRLNVDGKDGEYRAEFDVSRKDDQQIRVETVREEPGIHTGAAAQAKRFAVFALRGPCSYVVSYAPPIQWQAVPAADGRTLVVMPPWKGSKGASYRFDDKGLVALSGMTDGKSVVRTRFEWSWRECAAGLRAFLDKAVEDDGRATLEFRYAADAALPLLQSATLTEGLHTCGAVLAYDRLERKP